MEKVHINENLIHAIHQVFGHLKSHTFNLILAYYKAVVFRINEATTSHEKNRFLKKKIKVEEVLFQILADDETKRLPD